MSRIDWRSAGVIVALALVMGTWGLRGGDPVAADALWRHASEQEPDDLTAPVYLDAARELSRVRPWQADWTRSRERLHRIRDARRGRLK